MAVFISNGSDPRVEVRLPGDIMDELRTEMLIGVRQHEVLVPNAWIDEVNRTFPCILMPIDTDSIQYETVYGSFKCITFKSR